jgi:hypothetical protein
MFVTLYLQVTQAQLMVTAQADKGEYYLLWTIKPWHWHLGCLNSSLWGSGD